MKRSAPLFSGVFAAFLFFSTAPAFGFWFDNFISFWACTGTDNVCNNNQGFIGYRACTGTKDLCNNNQGEIRYKACTGTENVCNNNQGDIEMRACTESDDACNNNVGTIWPKSCGGEGACDQNQGTISYRSCNGKDSCFGIPAGVTIPPDSCNEDYACPFGRLECTTPPPAEFFSGAYLMEQLSGLDPFYGAKTFGDTQIVNITADGFFRSFDFTYFPGIFNSDYNFEMFLCAGEISVVGTINAGGLGCGGANIGFATGDPISLYDESFDPASDDVILVNVADFEPDGNCDTGSYPVELRFTEQ